MPVQSPGDANACYTLLANYGGAFYLDSIKVTYSPGTCQGGAAVYGQAHGKFTFGNDVVLGGTSTNAIVGEEQAFFWVKPGWSSSTGLTIDGTFRNAGIALSNSMFQSDPVLTVNGTFGRIIAASDLGDVKLSANPPIHVKSGGSVTGQTFSFSGNSVLLTSFTTTWPGTSAGQMINGAVWDGAVTPTTITRSSGWGREGGALLLSGATPYAGEVSIKTGSGPASSGSVTLSWPYATLNVCAVFNVSGFKAGSLFGITFSTDNTHPVLSWNSVTGPPNTTTITLGWMCR